MGYPLNQMDFEKQFASELDCQSLIEQLKWPEGFKCKKCNHRKYWKLQCGRYVCSKCRAQHYLLEGTLFERTRKSLMVWFRTVWWLVGQKNGVSALGLQRIIGLGSYETAWAWLHKFRRVMVIPGRDLLSGTVEVDEIFFGGKHSGKRGRGAEGKTLVAVGVELNKNKIGRIRLGIIPDANSDSLHKFIIGNIERGSTIISDGWRGYYGLTKKGYLHTQKKQTASVGEDALPHVHRVAALIKRWLLGTHQGRPSTSHLSFYLDEYTFRFNRRKSKSRGLLFMRIIEQAVLQGPTTFNQIKAKI